MYPSKLISLIFTFPLPTFKD